MDPKELDQLERREFEERLRRREEERKRRGDEAENKSLGSEAKKRRTIDISDAEQMRILREESRRVYVSDRVQKKLAEEQALLKAEAEMFLPEEQTIEELREREAKEKRLQIVHELQRVQKDDHHDRYHMPDAYVDEQKLKMDKAKKQSVLYQRYHDKGFDPQSDQKEWEKQQTEKAIAHFGSGNKQLLEQVKEYDLLIEDEIEFVSHAILEGKVEAPLTETQLEERRRQQEALAKLTERERVNAVRESLPIFKYKNELLKCIEENQVIIMVGETGSGKTTQITQYLRDAGYTQGGKRIACTQPRRVAAMSVAARVAQEIGTTLGHEIGYRIRFEDKTSDKTEVVYMTDGMLLREFLYEPDLGTYTVVIVDEAHERTLHTDIVFGLVKDVARFRKDFKLIISSATLEAAKFEKFFDGAPIFEIPGRRYNVEVFHTVAHEADYVEAAVVCALQIHMKEGPGDILIFLTGQDEIEDCNAALIEKTRALGTKLKELRILPIYSTLPSDEQVKIFEPAPPGGRKVVIATNIAETSLTIDGIVYVIDCGFCKQNCYNPRAGMESLVVVPISKASAIQRAGRAGRTQPGKCYRIYTKWSYDNELEENPIPEIQRTNLGNVVLLLKSLGIHDLPHFDFIDGPPAETLIKALEQLYALGALNDKGELTKLGRRMAEFPLDPQLSKTLVASEKYKCASQIASICAMLSVNNAIFFMPKDKKLNAETARKNFFKGGGDHLALLNVWEEYEATEFSDSWCKENFIQPRSMRRARDVREQLMNMMERVEIEACESEDLDNLKKAIASGYFFHTATLNKDGKSYRTIKTGSTAQTVYIHPSSHLFRKDDKDDRPPVKWMVYHELVLTNKEYMRNCLEIQPKWLCEIAPHYYKAKDLDLVEKKMPKTPTAKYRPEG
eukprot:TRINITY_DN40347_c0_g1_i1.p1 TRINITY_DN40347_c0_g1~~TRINITY_DN40347_c0_g1_i1.p1  ORF type:complete len:902 (+),score=227.97 TRINITY_DN40347_c0_g1_i1:31-2736(+)